MKKRYLMLILIIFIFSLSIVSASQDVSNDGTLGINNDLSAMDGSVENGALDDSSALTVKNEGSVGVANGDVTKATSKSATTKTAATTTTAAKKAKPAKVISNNITSTYGKKVFYKITVLDKNAKPIKGLNVNFTFVGKGSLVRTTDAKGMANVSCNCPAGSYVIKYKVGTLTGSNTYTVKNNVTLTTLNWGIKGDISNVKLIKDNMPNNALVKKAVAATKNGIPLLTFRGDKSGKVVFMTAGVHGNELSSQVAAMNLIKYLTNNPIKGTVYLMPFVNVKAISQKVRYTDIDFNRAAQKTGTIPNKIVKLVKKYNCNSYGDFHTTKPGGDPGQDIVMGCKSPTAESAKLTKYIATKCGVNQKVFKSAGEKYPGALFNEVNKVGISAVICEVMLPHNTVTKETVSTSYKMMKYFLKYNSLI